MSAPRQRVAAIGAAIAVLVLTACDGGDASPPATAPTTGTSSITTAPSVAATTRGSMPASAARPERMPASPANAGAASFDKDGFCRAFLAVDMAASASADPNADPAATAATLLEPAQAPAALAPPELADELAHSVTLLQRVATTGDGSLIEQALPTASVAWTSTNCGWTNVTATAEDYHFTGIPARLAAGDYQFTLTNTGTELHVLLITTREPGVTAAFDELLGDPAGQSELVPVLAVAAAPGDAASSVTHLEPGDYLVLCPVAVGTTGATQGTGPPHFTAGMRQLLTVTG